MYIIKTGSVFKAEEGFFIMSNKISKKNDLSFSELSKHFTLNFSKIFM